MRKVELRTAIMMAGSHVIVGLAAWAWAVPHLGLPPLDPATLGLVIVSV
jgi:inner membrane protein